MGSSEKTDARHCHVRLVSGQYEFLSGPIKRDRAQEIEILTKLHSDKSYSVLLTVYVMLLLLPIFMEHSTCSSHV